MKKPLKYMGLTFITIGATLLLAIGILIIIVIVGLLIDEKRYEGTVFFENDISEGSKYNSTFPEGMEEDTEMFDDVL
ncbi:hypothetical protein ACO1PF_11965 [Alkalibacterium sp. f15]|uniref:hypothetical protein n=1 Tax=Alkalibacterium sp. f15 TaxID=3414029 RepID=UPI003BF8689A